MITIIQALGIYLSCGVATVVASVLLHRKFRQDKKVSKGRFMRPLTPPLLLLIFVFWWAVLVWIAIAKLFKK